MAWVALSLIPHVGTKTIRNLVDHFGSAEAVLVADEKQLLKVDGVGRKTADAIQAINLEAVTAQISTWQAQGVRMLPREDEHYPIPLVALEDEPALLFAIGNYHRKYFQRAAAIVGTRNPTPRARQLAFQLGASLTEQGWTIVSGMALGIDTAAHQGALSIESATPVAVLGGGVLNLYPPENRLLAQRIMQKGAILSENPPPATSSAPRLVARNRIISGLSRMIIVIETETDGGAMYAAKAAIAQGRTLYAVDLPTSGNQALIKQGAIPISPTMSDFPR